MPTVNNPGWNLEATYKQLPKAFYSEAKPTSVRQPQLLLINSRVASRLGLDPKLIQDQLHAEIFAGNQLPPNSHPIAQAYAGHQFGGFTMLGDGRAILLGEQRTPNGDLLDVQLKGPGMTPYSRRGDGRAALGPMLREYIISHAMDSLGIPTTLSLAVTSTGEPVYRQRAEPGAVLTRIAASHIRVGTFQYAAARGNIDDLRSLADYTIARHYPELIECPDKYLRFLNSVIGRQAQLIAQWMSVGFIHGVMNTDNVSIAGETIDYGPCAFMNTYRPSTVFSSIDDGGRYAYGNQPSICQWNLARFAETLLPLLNADFQIAVQLATSAIEGFADAYQVAWLTLMSRKLGLPESQPVYQQLVGDLIELLERHQLDYINALRALSAVKPSTGKAVDYDTTCQVNASDFAMAYSTLVGSELADPLDDRFDLWLQRLQSKLSEAGTSLADAQVVMRQLNPSVVPRNHLVEQAIASVVEDGDFKPIGDLLEALSSPYEQPHSKSLFSQPPVGGDGDYCTFCGT